jgi:hypothetical protein
MGWSDFDTDTCPRSGLLPDDDPLAASRGCLFGLLFAAPFWIGVVAVAWRIATI